jgi:ABC-2 type transport system ATP-binding protein
MPDESVVRTHQLGKTYRDFWGRPRVRALHELKINIQPGEVFGLLGPNGSGKTTTIKLLLGLLRPSQGDAFLFGSDPSSRAVKQRLGYLPEETYLYRFLDASETLRFYGRLFGLPGRELRQRADALIDRVGLGHARHRRLGEYSKGMARRLGLAQALINQPELVILDEPTSGLDPLGTAEVKELIRELRQQGTTVLLCSHLLADVEDVCDRIAILHQGRLKACGAVDDLLTNDKRRVFTVDDPDAACAQALRQAAGDKLVTEAPPRERLEQFFRRIIDEDQHG